MLSIMRKSRYFVQRVLIRLDLRVLGYANPFMNKVFAKFIEAVKKIIITYLQLMELSDLFNDFLIYAEN